MNFKEKKRFVLNYVRQNYSSIIKGWIFTYLEKHKGNIELSDLYLTNLNQKKEYSVEMNQLVPSPKFC